MSVTVNYVKELETKVRELEGQVEHWRKAWADAQVKADLSVRPALLPPRLVTDMRRELRSALRRLHRIGESDATRDAERLTEVILRADAAVRWIARRRKGQAMKCYRCGEENPPGDVLVKLRDEAKHAAAELDEDEDEIEKLRAELRRYEPSDAMMHRLLDMQTRLDDAAGLLERWQPTVEGVGLPDDYSQANLAALSEGVTAWLERHRSRSRLTRGLHDEDRTLALHTVIDEGRRLFDKVCDQDANRATVGEDTWEAIDEWRNRVLVQQARETVSGALEACEQHVRILQEPRNEYGLALAAEQEKVKLLVRLVADAAQLLTEGWCRSTRSKG